MKIQRLVFICQLTSILKLSSFNCPTDLYFEIYHIVLHSFSVLLYVVFIYGYRTTIEILHDRNSVFRKKKSSEDG